MGLQGLVMADIISCFDHIPHAGMIDTLEIYIDDPLLVGLIRNFVQTDPTILRRPGGKELRLHFQRDPPGEPDVPGAYECLSARRL